MVVWSPEIGRNEMHRTISVRVVAVEARHRRHIKLSKPLCRTVVRVSTGEVTCPESVRGSRGTACMVRSSLEMRLIYHSFCWNRQSPTTNSAAGNSYCSTSQTPGRYMSTITERDEHHFPPSWHRHGLGKNIRA